MIENGLGDIDRRLSPHRECHGIRGPNVDGLLVSRLIQHQPCMESVVGQVGDLDATQMATEVGDHFGEDGVSHGSSRPNALQGHSDCLGFEGADPHWQHAFPIPCLEQEQRRDARGNHT